MIAMSNDNGEDIAKSVISSPRKLLQETVKHFTDDTGFIPVTATEIEFYLSGTDKDCANCLALILVACKELDIAVNNIEEESGEHQYEISLATNINPLVTAKNTLKLKKLVCKIAATLGMHADFSAKPFDNMAGNGIHINVSLIDKSGGNLFEKGNDDNNGDETSLMLYSIGGLCETMREYITSFAPNEESYKRFSSTNNNTAPVNISWGGNNRTTAIRIPTSTLHPENRHIEHRVSGADANPYSAINAVLSGVLYGIKHKIAPPEKIYGNAFDKQYNLPSIV